MKKLSYFAKSQIFLWTSVAVSVLDIFVRFPLLSVAWGALFAIGMYYWGREREAHKHEMERLDRNIELYGKISQRMW